ncbi:MAG: hypothetical protein OXF41_00925 [bacterium]|nr:hypothetical protein [bacterium]
MKRHSVNVFSLVFGVLLIMAAAWIAFPMRGWLFGTPHWLLPVAVILVGAALMSPLFTSRKENGRGREESGDAGSPMEANESRPGKESTSEGTTDERDGAASDVAAEA